MKRIPCATYRLQFNRDFTFEHAGEILDYLNELGISDIYASPLFEAGPQSTHGYDICCFSRINPNLGKEEQFESFTQKLKKNGLGLLVDIVPNHMSATLSNAWWRDVLEKGRESAYAGFFDIDWNSKRPGLHNKVLLPVLEEDYLKVLKSGKLRLAYENGNFSIAYHDRNFPVNAGALPPDAPRDPSGTVKNFNGINGQPRSFDKLDALIHQQHYRLAHWKVAPEEINYRRFFDVTEMVALKMELPEVYHETHRLLFDWLKSGKVTGLRVDHPDGLWDPKRYLQRLHEDGDPYIIVEKILSGDETLPKDWQADGTTGYDFLNRVNGLFVDAANASVFDALYRKFTGCNSVFREIVYESRKTVLERSFASELNSLTHRLLELASQSRSGCDFTFSQLRRAIEEAAANFPVYRTYISEASGEVSLQDHAVIEHGLAEAGERRPGDATVFDFLKRVLLLEIRDELGESGKSRLCEFVMRFQQFTGPAMAKGLEDTAFYRFNRLVSLNEVGGDPGRFGTTSEEFHQANRTIARHWPHSMLATSTHDTKRGEDVRARLDVLSEMPAEWEAAISRWSQLNADRKTALNGAGAPDGNDEYLLYQTLVGAWPDAAGTADGLESFRTRVIAFMLKAAREAKVNTSWTEPHAGYEDALRNFIESVLAAENNEVFLADLERFAHHVAFFGRTNSLAQTLLKITSPGVPDFYQGSELSNLSLVDPDNRRPVDYSLRRELLFNLKNRFAEKKITELISQLLRDGTTGAAKLFLIWRALNFRKQEREIFDSGEYMPLSAKGEKWEHVCAFARTWNDRAIVIVVPRLVFRLTNGTELHPLGLEVWKNTTVALPSRCGRALWQNVLTKEHVSSVGDTGEVQLGIGDVLKTFPVALLSG